MDNKIPVPNYSSMNTNLLGKTLSDRYVIIRQVGQGGFGRTYLAEDMNRFREYCVLKEFSPVVQTPDAIQKAQELFEREATVLYKLEHPQIPRFRELLPINLEGKEYLFLVQDYVQGTTYSSLLNTQQQQGVKFSETAVRQLLEQILPVLQYIHSMGVIHRDISPDNLILRSSDQLPVLIDFGGVKQVAANLASQYYQSGQNTPSSGTLLGKVGFAPPEQMQTGLVYPHSDLYALAVTVLVLLTGKMPQEIIDTQTLQWQWRREVRLSPLLGQVLDRMLSYKPGDRYQTANQVLDALNFQRVSSPMSGSLTSQTMAISQPSTPMTSTPETTGVWTTTNIMMVTMAIFTSAGLLWWGFNNRYQPTNTPSVTSPTPTTTPSVDPTANYSPEEKQRKQKLRDRLEELNINSRFFSSLVNQVFWEKNPSLTGRTLSSEPEDESLRKEWDKTAMEVVEKLAILSENSRRQLGTYTSSTRQKWQMVINSKNVSSNALYDLADAALLRIFPEQKGKNFISKPLGQVWQGFANDRLNDIMENTAWEKIVLDPPGNTSKMARGTLDPGGGKVFIAKLVKDQNMQVQLDANTEVLLSVYSPSGKTKFLQDSKSRQLSQILPESGFYEFVVVSTASNPEDYEFSLTIENPPAPEPIETPTPETTPEPVQ
ncbi:serine/threonine protein kinase [Cylindrospermopsis raciborskii S07]|uniref:non-specific serine/threonine protein kinase n=1 Tax=Cylindrospermopsis raciborskii CS-505 TaxID=533240 RepID=A0A853MBD6_9CYAN|nr:Serine/Threonine protein kinase [Cylindrospermopsis raciborskii CS-505]PNK04350.1 serine/threonine protein kinase [Cylindrospermopsis raciborskii S07]PNK08303.1 serine/threonine protein kinase [Cylindrospermopsis raciborskii S10]PNK10377.1 serine/threonine protein kinase [Cylindrospermopsis raciborskii S06]PNK12384.1 serine/threonine protein kinase [Cylindrospermopsis raciborskii S14]PNK17265.1 serine/threonine protein kinase [Cylindrospermopsis raciborskii S05]